MGVFRDCTPTQDVPPPGGYKPICYKRVPCKQLLSAPALIIGYLAITAGATYLYSLNCKSVKKDRVENRSGRLAILPVLVAERDREYLKQLRRNRDEEEELMKNVEGWEVGTWYGEPIYHTLKDEFIEPSYREYFAHSSYRDTVKRAHIALWS